MSELKVVVATDLTDEALEMLAQARGVTLARITPTLPTLREALQQAHALIAREDVLIDRELLQHAPRLKVIGRVGAGLGNLDMEAATARGIIVTNTPGANAIAAGELTLALMLALSRRLVTAHNSLRDGYWLLDRKQQAGTQLEGKTIGLVGYGRVGRVVAQRCLAFGMTVLAYDPYITEDQINDRRIQQVALAELLQRSDFISLHLAVTSETRGLFNRELIARIKPGARLVNAAHGSIWDEAAVADALKSGHLAGVAVDVYAQEPPHNSLLIGLDNVVHTPHIGDNTIEAAQDLSTQIVTQVLDALNGRDYRNVVNMPFLPGAPYAEAQPYMALAERMGTVLHTLSRYPVKRVDVEYRGEQMSGMVKPLTVALLKGILTPVLGDTVNYINAPVIAAERGIQVMQTKGLKTAHYTNLVSCQVTLEDGEQIIMAGTLLDQKEPHIVQVNEYRMDFVPQGHLLILGSQDKPGVIGRVGTLLAENGVNIASWQTGRVNPGGHTLTVLTLDEPVPDDVMLLLNQQEFIRHAHQVAI